MLDEILDKEVGSICAHDISTISPDDALWRAIRVMNNRDVGRVPVVESGTREVVGLIRRRSIMHAYNMALACKLEDQHMAERIRLNTLTGAHVLEIYIEPNASVVGKCIAQVHWPTECNVAAIRRDQNLTVPHGSTEIKAGDLLTIVLIPPSQTN